MQEINVRDVKWHSKSHSIAQIPKEGLEFAMLSNDYKQLNQLVWCKDFMQDIIWSHLNKKAIEIFGFKYDPYSMPAPCTKRVRLMLSNYKDPELGDKIINNMLPLLNSVEKRLRMSETKIEKCHLPPPVYRKSGVWIVDGSKRWLKAPPMLSFYTFLIRIGLVHQAGDTLEMTLDKIANGVIKSYYDNNMRDKFMAKNAMKGISILMKQRDTKIFPSDIKLNYPSHYEEKSFTGAVNRVTMKVHSIHDRCGIVGFSESKTKTYFPNWHKEGAIV